MGKRALTGPVAYAPYAKAPMEVRQVIANLRMSGPDQSTIFHPEKGWTPKPLFVRAMSMVIAAIPLIALATFLTIRVLTDTQGETFALSDGGLVAILGVVAAGIGTIGGLGLLVLGLKTLVQYLDLVNDPYAQGVVISSFFLIFREWGSVFALPWSEIKAFTREREGGRQQQTITIEPGTLVVAVRYGDGETWFRQAKAFWSRSMKVNELLSQSPPAEEDLYDSPW